MEQSMSTSVDNEELRDFISKSSSKDLTTFVSDFNREFGNLSQSQLGLVKTPEANASHQNGGRRSMMTATQDIELAELKKETKSDLSMEKMKQELRVGRKKANKMDKRLQEMKVEIGELRAMLESRNDNNNDEEDENNNEDGNEQVLPQDTFSFLVVCPTFSRCFAFAVLVYLFQMIIFTMMITDLIAQGSGETNPLGIPGDVSRQLRLCQLIAILISVFTQGDLLTGFGVFRHGYNKMFKELFQYAAPWKHWLSILTRLSEGSVGLVIAFFLIISAQSVVELLMNFTAIEFVSNLDDCFFYLSQQGFLGKFCEEYAYLIENTTYVVEKKFRRCWQTASLLTILVAMTLGWAVVIDFQESGVFLCSTILVQFGDDFRPELGTFSGLYDLQPKPFSLFSEARVVYAERRALNIGIEPAIFQFCTSMNSWTLSYWQGNENDYHPCNWIARSEKRIESYDLLEIAASQWYVKDTSGRAIDLSPIHMSCVDCRDTSGGTPCGGHGTCLSSNGMCECDDGWHGVFCEFASPCESLSVDFQTDDFVSTRDWAREFTLLRDNDDNHDVVEAYGRPVYVHEYNEDPVGYHQHDIMVYTGRRWGLTSTRDIIVAAPSSSEHMIMSDLPNYFQNSFHAHVTNLTFAFLSEPADLGTPKDAVSPVNLDWFRASNKKKIRHNASGKIFYPDAAINTRLFCQICNDETNPCLYDGICNVNGTCECSPGAAGGLCQTVPASNGYCNQFFNTPEFRLDGGDCCESTCISTAEFECGYDATGSVFIGYPHCRLERGKWQSQMFVGEDFSLSGSQVAISRSGSILAIAEPGANRIRLFDKDASEWLPRQATANVVVPDDIFIMNIAMSSGLSHFLNSVEILAPVLLAVSGFDDSLRSTVSVVYFCTIRSCEEYGRFPEARAVSVSGDGSTVAFGFNDRVEVVRVDVTSSYRPLRVVANVSVVDTVRYISTWNDCVFDYDTTKEFGLSVKSIQLSTDGDEVGIELWDDPACRMSSPGSNEFSFYSVIALLTWSPSSSGKQVSELQGGSFNRAMDGYAKIEEVHARRFYLEMNGYGFNKQPPLNAAFRRPSFAMAGNAQLMLVTSDNCVHQVLSRRGGRWVSYGGAVNNTEMAPNACISERISPAVYGGFDEIQVAQPLAMSADGSTIAIGIDIRDVVVFRYNDNSWQQVDTVLQGGSRISIALSYDGTSLAVGRPFDQRNDAGTTVIHSTLLYLPEEYSDLRLFVIPDTTETRWEMRNNQSQEIILEGNSAMGIGRSTATSIVPTNECFTFTLYPYQFACIHCFIEGKESSRLDEPAKFDIFLDGTNVNSVKVATNASEWGHKTLYPPRQILVGNCAPCPEGTRLLQVMVHPCSFFQDVVLSIRDNDNGFDVISTVLEANSGVTWESSCIATDRCYTVSVGIKGLETPEIPSGPGGRNLQARSMEGSYTYVFLEGDLVAYGIDSFDPFNTCL